MTHDVRWLVARGAAMSPREIAWRLRSALSAPLEDARNRKWTPARIEQPEWRARLLDLLAPEPSLILETADRIAAGELSLWGRKIGVDPAGPDWSLDPLTGERWEGKAWRGRGRDPKPTWEIHHLHHLVPLAVGSALSGRAELGRLVVEQSSDWIERNPRARGIGWASAYEVSHRLIAWGFALPLVSEHATEAERSRLGAAIAEHRAYVAARPSRYSSANNHRLVELTGLLAGSLLTPGLPDWDELWVELEDEAREQTYSDGGSREQAAGYFLYALEALWVAAAMAHGAGRDPGRLTERLQRMVEWLAAVADERGEPPPFGDDAEDRVFRLDYFNPRQAREITSRVARLGIRVPPRSPSSTLLPESGYAIFRCGAVRLAFDFGELGFGSLAAHGHADALSVLLDGGGHTLLRDTGTGSYVEGRDDDRATSFHNTVTLGGESQAEALGPHLWGRRYRTRLEASLLSPEVDYVRASHDGYRPARHTRSVTRLGDSLVVVFDRVTAPKPVLADLVWQPGPGLPEGPVVLSVPRSEPEELPGRFSPRYTWTQSARRLVWPARGVDVVFATVVPLDGAPLPPLRLERRESAVLLDIGDRRLVEDWASNALRMNVGRPEDRASV